VASLTCLVLVVELLHLQVHPFVQNHFIPMGLILSCSLQERTSSITVVSCAWFGFTWYPLRSTARASVYFFMCFIAIP
jgi:hypothetical protein